MLTLTRSRSGSVRICSIPFFILQKHRFGHEKCSTRGILFFRIKAEIEAGLLTKDCAKPLLVAAYRSLNGDDPG